MVSSLPGKASLQFLTHSLTVMLRMCSTMAQTSFAYVDTLVGNLISSPRAWNYYPSHLTSCRNAFRPFCSLVQALTLVESTADLSDEKAASNLCFSRQQEQQSQPSSHRKSIAAHSLLVGAPKRLLDCLQSVLNAAARLLCNGRKYDHITPLLCDVLHWIPLPLRVEFKICLLVYKSLHGAAPGYLREYCKEMHSSSTDNCNLHVRRMKTRFGNRAFSTAGPRCWNRLPAALRTAGSIDSFKTGLRTYLFRIAYPGC